MSTDPTEPTVSPLEASEAAEQPMALEVAERGEGIGVFRALILTVLIYSAGASILWFAWRVWRHWRAP